MGSGVSVSAVLGVLANLGSSDEVLRELRWPERVEKRNLTLEDVRAAIAYGAQLVRPPLTADDVRAAVHEGANLTPTARLSAPAAHMLKEGLKYVGAPAIEEVLPRAPEALDRLAAETDRPLVLGAGDEIARGALVLASILAKDARTLPVEAPDERHLRDMLDEHDRRVIDAYVYYRTLAPGVAGQTPERVLQVWRRFVEKVDGGYSDSDFEYTHYLYEWRPELERMVLKLSPSGRARWRHAIDPLDRQFEAATRPSARPLFNWAPDLEWWWFRVPIRAEGEFRRSLEIFGYL